MQAYKNHTITFKKLKQAYKNHMNIFSKNFIFYLIPCRFAKQSFV